MPHNQSEQISPLKQKLIQQLTFIYQHVEIEQPLTDIAQDLIDIMDIADKPDLTVPFKTIGLKKMSV